MSIRIFKFKVSLDTITPSSVAIGGEQGEHRATELKFELDDLLKSRLRDYISNKQGKLYYRFDGYNSAGGKLSTNPIIFEIDDTTEVSYIIERWQTKYSGLIQVCLAITFVNEDTTKMELYSCLVKLRIKSRPDAEYVDGESYESMTTLAEVAKSSAETAVKSAEAAVEAQKKTEQAKIALEGGTFWVFDGGDASSEADIKFVIDGELSDTSENAVKNRVVSKEIKSLKESDSKINKEIETLNTDLAKTELTKNKVNRISSESNEDNYPSARAVYNHTLKPSMTVYLKSESVCSQEVILLNEVLGQSNCEGGYLVSENGGIKIGAGVSKVMVSGQMFCQMENSIEYLWAEIRRYKENGDYNEVSIAIDATTQDYASVTFSPIVVDVEPNDLFCIFKFSETNDTVRSLGNTYMTVQVLEMSQEDEE